MKKIALNYIYLNKSHGGGKDQVGVNLLKGLYENGYTGEMYIICYDYSVGLIKSLAPDIEIISLKSHNIRTELFRMITLCYDNTVVIPRIIRKKGIQLICHINCNTGLGKVKAVSVVLPHDIKAVSHRVLANIKIPFYKYLLHKLLYYIDFRTNDKIIAISETDKKEIAKHYPKYADKIERIYNPIDIPPYPHNTQTAKKDIVAINLQFHHKNIITLIKAFELIKDQIEDNLILIGRVPKRVQYLKDYVKEHALENRIFFTDFVNDEKKRQLFCGCKLYVNPTLYEGFGMTAVEAIILGIPTLVSKIDANYEVTKGLCMYYEPPEDESALASKILDCLGREISDAKKAMAGNALYNEYNYANISRQYHALLDSLL